MITDKKEYHSLQKKLNDGAEKLPLCSPEMVKLSQILDEYVLESMRTKRSG